MTALQAFLHFLYALQHSTQLAEVVQKPTAGQGAQVVYEGNALQAFLIVLAHPLLDAFQWVTNVVTG